MNEKTKRLTRRDFLRLSALATSGAVITACARPTPTPVVIEKVVTKEVEKVVTATPAPVRELTLDFWFGWSGVWGDACKELANAFEEQNPGITVNTVEHGWAQEKLLTAFAGGVPPDVMEHYAPIEFAAREQLLDIDPRIANSAVIDKDNYFDVMWAASTWQGKLYGIPAFGFGADDCLIMQNQATETAGLDLDDPPQTWDELFVWADKLTTMDEAGNLLQIGFDPRDGVADYPYCWANSFGMGVYDPEAQKFSFDDPRWVDIFNLINDWIHHWGGPQKFEGFRETYGGWLAPTSSFCQGTQILQLNGYWSPGEIALKCKKELDWSYAWAPRAADYKDETYQILGGHNATIPKDSKYPDEAFRFLEYLSTDEAQRIVFFMAGGYVSTKSWLEKANVDFYPGLEFYINSPAEADNLYIYEPCPVDFVIWDQWYTQLDAVLWGDKTAEEAAADMYKNATAELESALAG